MLILSALLLIDLALGYIALPIIMSFIRQMHAGEAWQPLQSVFNRVAVDAYKTPLTLYLDRAYRIFLWIRIPLACIILRIDVALLELVSPSFEIAFQAAWVQIRPILFAGAVLGIATTLRAPAAFIGILVVIFAMVEMKSGAIVPLVIYAISAFVALYLTWPYMWETPIANFLETLKVLSDFAPHTVLFRGEILSSNNLPWDYLPTLLGLQLSEPIPVLAVIGIGVIIFDRMELQKKIISTLLLVWFALPTAVIIGAQTPLYGNTRQVLFLLPPLFFFSGFTLDKIDARLNHDWMKSLLIFVLLLPGIWGILRLHPYEYTYFNQYSGGTKGAYTQYDLDYWCTSYREAAVFLNLTAAPESVVVVVGPEYGVRNFIREDIRVFPEWQKIKEPDYVVFCETASLSRFKNDLPIIYTILRKGAVFTQIQGVE
ncbi:MAG: hypothetical protein E4G99_05895 [Anaerolineales bacterium]|nr:MAG: hypothetical protein E4G99_05895 [Anaerolineales bacterium]